MALFHEVEFWILIAFVVAVVILVRKGLPGLTGNLDARAERIRQSIEEAKRLRAEAEATLGEYQRKQRDAMSEAQAIVTQAQADAERLAAQAEAALARSLAQREQQVLDKIAQAEARALTEVRNVAVSVAIQATRQIMIESLTPERSSALIDQAIESLPPRLH